MLRSSGPAKFEYLFRTEEFSGEIDLKYLQFGSYASINGIPSLRFPQNPDTDFEGAVQFSGQRNDRDDEIAVEHTFDGTIVADGITYEMSGNGQVTCWGEADEPVNGNPISGIHVSNRSPENTGTLSDGRTFSVNLSAYAEAYR